MGRVKLFKIEQIDTSLLYYLTVSNLFEISKSFSLGSMYKTDFT